VWKFVTNFCNDGVDDDEDDDSDGKVKGRGHFFGVYSALRLCKLIVPLPLRTSFLHH
jgi:hypothetical protein